MDADAPVTETTVATAPDSATSELAVTTGPPSEPGAPAQPLDLLALPADASLGQYVTAWGKRVRAGDSGVLPVLVGLIAIVIIFQTQSSVFLSASNLTNLLEQGAPFVMLGMAEVFVLLLGEIDLSIGYSGAVGAAVTTILAYPPINFGWALAIAAGLATTAGIGFLQGQLITRLRLPSFVVTLAGLLFWEGFLIWLINNQSPSNGGSIRILNPVIHNIIYGTLNVTVGWVAMAVGVAIFGVFTLRRDRRRRASGLVAPPLRFTALKIAGMAAAGIVLVAVCNTNRGVPHGFVIRGVPWVVPIVLAFVVSFTFLLNRTRFGRYIYAIGGNSEAARRAGINVRRIRLLAFTLAGFTAGAGMIIYASRLGSMSSDVDGGQIVLYAVAAAVIGGASLFGGRGKMIHALLGGIVIATIYNGMGLLNLSSAVQYMVTALVLLAAVTVDAVSRRGSTVS
jgi:D-xylose transport system permease protein